MKILLFLLVNGIATNHSTYTDMVSCEQAGVFHTSQIAKYRDGVNTLSFQCKESK